VEWHCVNKPRAGQEAIDRYNPTAMRKKFLASTDAAAFLRRHWQKEPLVARGAFREYRAIVTREQLMRLARRDDIESKIVISARGRWRILHGPFEARDFARLPARGWTLLVHGVDLVLAGMARLQREFSFLPYARFDDVMASYAAPGGGVGPHFDSYDVFLLQGQGTRRWRFGRQRDLELDPGAPLKILRRFRPEQQWDLEPGDLLYLPPRYAHDGVALDECVTYSVGFRAPQAQELAERFLDDLRDRVALEGMYEDAGITTTREPARIPGRLVVASDRWIDRLRWSGKDVARFLGSYLTEPKPHVVFERPRAPLAVREFERRARAVGLELMPATRMLYDSGNIFINGEMNRWPSSARRLMKKLANDRALVPPFTIPPAARGPLHDWYAAGYIRLTRP
jgi:50S ribosomal protein L16 3-hydroxylase